VVGAESSATAGITLSGDPTREQVPDESAQQRQDKHVERTGYCVLYAKLGTVRVGDGSKLPVCNEVACK
jgi:hypothetical protein